MATIGNTLHTNTYVSDGDEAHVVKIQFPSTALVSSISAYIDVLFSSRTWKGCIWDSSGNLVASTAGETGPTTASWDTISFSSSVLVYSGVDYYIGVIFQLDSETLYYSTSNTYPGYLDASNDYSLPESIGTPSSNNKWAIYCTYTAVELGQLTSDNFNDNTLASGTWTYYDYDGASGNGTLVEENQRIQASGTITAISNKWDQEIFQENIYGDFDVRVKVVDLYTSDGADDDIFGGLIINGDSDFYFITVDLWQGTKSIYWSDDTVSVEWTLPYWVRMVRDGNTLYVYSSANGSSWTLRDSTSLSDQLLNVGIFGFQYLYSGASPPQSGYVYLDDFVVVDQASDSFTLQDSATPTYSGTVPASDGLTISDSVIAGYPDGYILGDISLTWEQSTGNLYETTTTGTVSFGDTTSATVAFAASTSDSLGVNDTPTAVGTYITSTSDSSTFNDTTTVSGLYSTSTSEGFSINDSTSGVLLITCSGVDSFTFNDTTSGTSFILKTVIDSFTMNDVGAGVANFTTSLIENSSFGDTSSATLTAITAISDGVNLSDTTDTEVSFDVSLTDTLVFSDSTAQELLIALTLVDGLTIQDNTSGVSQIPVSTSEVVLVSDTNSPSVLINFTVSDGVELQDAVNAITSFATTIGDGFTLSLTVDGIQVGIKIVLKALNKTYTFIGKVNTYTIAAKRRSPSSGK